MVGDASSAAPASVRVRSSSATRPRVQRVVLFPDMTTLLARRPEDAWFSRISAQNG